jgi:hypothetical protein
VTNCRFSKGDKKLVTTGGADTSVMVWNHIAAVNRTTACGESDESDTDSEEEGGMLQCLFKAACLQMSQNISRIKLEKI